MIDDRADPRQLRLERQPVGLPHGRMDNGTPGQVEILHELLHQGGGFAPGVALPLVKEQMQKESDLRRRKAEDAKRAAEEEARP